MTTKARDYKGPTAETKYKIGRYFFLTGGALWQGHPTETPCIEVQLGI